MIGWAGGMRGSLTSVPEARRRNLSIGARSRWTQGGRSLLGQRRCHEAESEQGRGNYLAQQLFEGKKVQRRNIRPLCKAPMILTLKVEGRKKWLALVLVKYCQPPSCGNHEGR